MDRTKVVLAGWGKDLKGSTGFGFWFKSARLLVLNVRASPGIPKSRIQGGIRFLHDIQGSIGDSFLWIQTSSEWITA